MDFFHVGVQVRGVLKRGGTADPRQTVQRQILRTIYSWVFLYSCPLIVIFL